MCMFVMVFLLNSIPFTDRVMDVLQYMPVSIHVHVNQYIVCTCICIYSALPIVTYMYM